MKSHLARKETSGAERDFGDGERIHGEKDFGQIHIMKSHFEDEERLRKYESVLLTLFMRGNIIKIIWNKKIN